jgi:hypothetical protein
MHAGFLAGKPEQNLTLAGKRGWWEDKRGEAIRCTY